jgi:methylated-DNA-protein-cysteine methyltransferase-like protein
MGGHSNRGITYDRIYSMVRRIPKGRVATYGQIARLVGIPRQARQIGYALAALRDHPPVPWHRVVNSKGEISQRSESGFEERQRLLLEREGVVFDLNGRISLSRFRWRPKDAVHHLTARRLAPSNALHPDVPSRRTNCP